MRKAKYKSTLADFAFRRNLWAGVGLVMIAANFLLVVKIVSTDTREKTIITPAYVTKEFWSKGDSYSTSYIEEMTLMFAGLYHNYQPDNVHSQFDILLKYVDPSAHGEIKARLDVEADKIKRRGYSSVFYPGEQIVKEHQAVIAGTLKGIIGDDVVSTKETAYLWKYGVSGGRFSILGWEPVVKSPDGKTYLPATSMQLE